MAGDVGQSVEVPAVVAPLQSLVHRLTPDQTEHGFFFRCHEVANDDVNALALPGGRIVIFSGLIDAVGNLDELAGVLAHEVAHVLGRDHLRLAARNLGARGAVAVLVGVSQGLLAAGGELAAATVGPLTAAGRRRKRIASASVCCTPPASIRGGWRRSSTASCGREPTAVPASWPRTPTTRSVSPP